MSDRAKCLANWDSCCDMDKDKNRKEVQIGGTKSLRRDSKINNLNDCQHGIINRKIERVRERERVIEIKQ